MKIALAVARTFSTTVEQVLAIRAQNMGWGEVYKLFLLAKLTGQTPLQIMQSRQEGMGWGQIFKAQNLSPGLGKITLPGGGKATLGQSLKEFRLSNTSPVSGTVTIKPNKDKDDKNDDQGKHNTTPANPNRGSGNPGGGRPADKPRGKNK